MPSLQFTCVALAFVFCCAVSAIRLAVEAPKPSTFHVSAADITSRSDQRFAELKTMLPQRGVVGYFGEAGSSPATVGSYYLTQYALAPVVVDHSTNHPLVVGNFRLPQTQPLPESLKLVKDFGNGVLLFKSEEKQ